MAASGLNFRGTSGYVTDGAGQTYVVDDDYPRVRDGQTFGWETVSIGGNIRNRTTGADYVPELAGVHFALSGDGRTFRIDLPSSGDYNLRLAAGDTFSGGNQYVEFFDDTTSFATPVDTESVAASEYHDAAGTKHASAAAWQSDNATISRTFSSSIWKIQIGGHGGVSAATPMAHLEYEAAGGADHALLADDLSTTPSLTDPEIGQTHALTADDLATAGTLTEPALAQVHALTADDVDTTPTLSTPALSEAHALAGEDLSTAPALDTPALAQHHVLAAADVSTASALTEPALGQVHALAGDDVTSAPALSEPVLSIGTVQLFAEDLEIVVQLGEPGLGQVHALAAEALNAAPSLGTPTLAQHHALTADDVSSAPALSEPAIAIGVVQLFADDLEIVVQLGTPGLGQVHALAGEDVAATPALAPGVLEQLHVLTGEDIATTALLGNPALNALGLGVVTNPRIEVRPGYSIAARALARTVRVRL